MKNRILLTAAAVVATLPFSFQALGQEKDRAMELGIGGSVMNLTRATVSGFHQTSGGDYVFNLEDKHLYGGIQVQAAMPLTEWLHADAQAVIGIVRQRSSSGALSTEYSFLAGPGLEFRPFVKSLWVQPYLRLGINYFGKNFQTKYFGTFEGDVTGEGLWRAEDSWNKGYTFDDDRYFPVSAGIGVRGWLGNHVGIGVQGQYLMPLDGDGANFAQASASLVFRFGGGDKRKVCADGYVHAHPSDYDGFYSSRLPERVVEKKVTEEVPVERIVEKIVERPFCALSGDYPDNIKFDFDEYDIPSSYDAVLDAIAKLMTDNPDQVFALTGYADSRGNEEYNLDLSTKRAKAVWDELVRRGVPKESIVWIGAGNRAAIVPPSASEGQRQFDRKVVVERVTDDNIWKYLNNLNK